MDFCLLLSVGLIDLFAALLNASSIGQLATGPVFLCQFNPPELACHESASELASQLASGQFLQLPCSPATPGK